MTTGSDMMKLFLFVAPVGYHTDMWKQPESWSEKLYGVEIPKYLAQRAEQAKFHAAFLADLLHFDRVGPSPDHTGYEPFTTIGALSQVTEKIGLIATASTTFMEPYHLARYFNQLDFLTKGRVGWNIVTSGAGAENFSMSEMPEKDDRYQRAREHLEVARKLWDAWKDDAVINDRERGVWALDDRIAPINHEGQYYKVEGPLIVPRSPQGWPVLVQAGQSEAGLAFAGELAEAVFTSQGSMDLARIYYDDLKGRVAAAGRDPKKLTILPGLLPIVGDTHAEAEEYAEELSGYINLDYGLEQIKSTFQHLNFDEFDLDDVIPADRLPSLQEAAAQGFGSRYPRYHHLVTEEKYTIRRLIREITLSRGHAMTIGTAEEVADFMQEWYQGGVCDGFVIQPAGVPKGIDRFFDQVVPILQERGLFRTDYEGDTLRENLGLERPAAL